MKPLFLIASGLVGLVILVIVGAAIYIHFSFSPPKRVQVGMSFQDFDKLCTLDVEDWIHMRTTETASGTTSMLTLSFNEKDREKGRENDCYGTFIFVNDKLTSISR